MLKQTALYGIIINMKNSNKKTNIMTALETDGAMLSDVSERSEAAEVHDGDRVLRYNAGRNSFFARLLTYLSIPVFAASFAAFVYFRGGRSVIGLIAPALSLLFFAAVTLRLIPAIVLKRDPSGVYPVGERSQKRLHPVVKIIFFSLFAQVFVLLTVYVVNSLINGFDFLLPGGYLKLFAQPRGLVFGENTRSIASSIGLLSFVLPQYVERASYAPALHITLFAANALAFAAASVFVYELVICDHSKRRAKFAVLLLHLLPAALILLQLFSGTAFFFAFSLLALLLARKKRILAAGIAALAASLFSIFAVLLVVPIAVEWRMHSVFGRGVDGASRERPVKPAVAFVGLLLAVLPAVAAPILMSSVPNGLSALKGSDTFHFNPIGKLLSAWDGGAIPRSLIIVSIAAFVLLAMLIFFGAKHARASHTSFALVFTFVPSILAPDYALYSVFALPLLASLIAEKCSFRAARTMTALVSFAALLLTVIFLYVKRAA